MIDAQRSSSRYSHTSATSIPNAAYHSNCCGAEPARRSILSKWSSRVHRRDDDDGRAEENSHPSEAEDAGHLDVEEAEHDGDDVEQDDARHRAEDDAAEAVGDLDDARGIEHEHREGDPEGESHGDDGNTSELRLVYVRDPAEGESFEHRVDRRGDSCEIRSEYREHRDDERRDGAAEDDGVDVPVRNLGDLVPRVSGARCCHEHEGE